jgi:hypothetical protein
LANSVGGGGRAMGSASPPAGWQHRGEGSAVCSLSDFRLARSLSLSVGAWLPSAAPDSARALDWAAADFCLANSVGGGGRAMGSASPPAGWQHRGEGSPPCALSQISGWRDRCLYTLLADYAESLVFRNVTTRRLTPPAIEVDLLMAWRKGDPSSENAALRDLITSIGRR